MNDALDLSPPEDLIGIRAFARLVGVSHASVVDAIDAGRLTAVVKTRNGRKLVREAALLEWEEVHQVKASEPVAARSVSDEDLDESGEPIKWGAEKTKQEALLAVERRRKLILESMAMAGELLYREDVEQLQADMIMAARSKLLALPNKLAADLAPRCGLPAPEIQALAKRLVDEALLELSEYDPEKYYQLALKKGRQIADPKTLLKGPGAGGRGSGIGETKSLLSKEASSGPGEAKGTNRTNRTDGTDGTKGRAKQRDSEPGDDNQSGAKTNRGSGARGQGPGKTGTGEAKRKGSGTGKQRAAGTGVSGQGCPETTKRKAGESESGSGAGVRKGSGRGSGSGSGSGVDRGKGKSS
jgi:hypothetical protein